MPATLSSDDQWIHALVATLPGAQFAYKPEWDTWVLMVAGKLFGMRGSHQELGEIITLKGDPADNESLRQEFTAVVPGYYTNKQHWNSVALDTGEVPQDRLDDLVRESYALVRAKLPKAVRESL
ncbi:MAG: hypothetical protein CVT64_05240 [Actinobacteria bacterium HGW-Actinobacteria-4]|nr:MAG: hypothetical protein CVT64_05240 [Actinobacteria bacterium HGW-Actinobacteria-4]